MAEWFDAASVSLWAKSGDKHVIATPIGGVIVVRLDDGFVALEDRCSHDQGALGSGICDGETLVCPRHGARFCLRSGAALSAPAYEAIECFDVRVHEGQVQIDLA